MFKSLFNILYNLLIQKPYIFFYLIMLFFYAFIFIIIFNILQEKKKLFLNANKDEYISVFKLLNYYYVYNIYCEIFLLCLLFLISSGMLLILRFFNIGNVYHLWFIFSAINDFNFVFMLFIFFLIIIIIYIFNLLSTIIKDIYFIIHLYFFQNKIYYDFIYYINDKGVSFSLNIITQITVYLSVILDPDTDRNAYFLKICFKNSKDETFTKFIFFMIAFVKKNIIIKNLLLLLASIIIKFNIEFKVRCLKEKWPLIMLYIILLYDVKHEEIKYTYYALLVYLIITLYRKFRTFIGQLDMFEIDLLLAQYYYGNLRCKNHGELAGKTQREMVLGMGLDTSNIYENIEKIKEYFNRGFVVDYIDIKFKMSYEPYSVRFIFIGLVVFYYIFCYNLNILDSILISIPLIMAIIIYEYAYYFRETIKKKWVYIISYKSFLLIAIIIGLWIYVTRHTLYFFTDIIWSQGIEIIQTFTTEEKRLFMERYSIYFIEMCNSLSSFEKTEFLYLTINLNIMLKEIALLDMDIHMLKMFIEDMLYDYISLQKSYLQETILFQERLIYEEQFNQFMLFIAKAFVYLFICYLYAYNVS